MTEKDDLYAKMMREVLITREETLSRLEDENEIYFDEIQDLLNQIGIRNSSILNKL